jgi:threonine dehydrogenase-like Zn-dependent dehydrogenase
MEVVGSPEALRLSMDILRPGGTISSVGVHTARNFSFSPGEAYDKNLVYKIGRCPAHYYAEKLLREQVIQRYPAEKIITHHFTLNNGVKAYEIFDKKLDNCIKAVLHPVAKFVFHYLSIRGFRFYKCINFVVSNLNCRLCF